jgi:hypothetical protein
VSFFGPCASSSTRACRRKGWTRDQVVDYFRKSGAIDEPTIQTETDRYIAWPAQALAYKLGQLKFRELRDRAQKELGAKFDIRAFHDEMLNGGVLPLDLLDSRTDGWIRSQKLATARAPRTSAPVIRGFRRCVSTREQPLLRSCYRADSASITALQRILKTLRIFWS